MMKINARDCKIVTVDKEVEKNFLTNNHTQGYVRSIICYGLILNGELVQLMSFGKPRFNKNYQWELLRDCSKKYCIVRGGVSKLWKHFVNENKPKDVICYSYPHNGTMYTNKYINNCGFNNIKNARKTKKTRYIGNYRGKEYSIEKSILEKHGVDRLLKGKFGQNRTNEQILFDLGFKKELYDGLDPQVDSWFCGGCVYMMEIIGTDKFYIGQTIKDINTYWGSGSEWIRYLDENNIPKDNKHIRKIILKDNGFYNWQDLRDAELEEIHKYCFKNDNGVWEVKQEFLDKMLNRDLWRYYKYNFATCPECGGKNGQHKNGCSRLTVCPECGLARGHHKKTCSKYNLKEEICPECGGIAGHHRKGCSKHKTIEICKECGSPVSSHKKTCSKYVKNKCDICCSIPHKKWCPRHIEPEPCKECGGTLGHHRKGCSKYIVKKKQTPCSECGAIQGHYKTCSKYKPNKQPEPCSECGGKNGHHKKFCSKYEPHKKPVACPECGSMYGHKKTCSKYTANNGKFSLGTVEVN